MSISEFVCILLYTLFLAVLLVKISKKVNEVADAFIKNVNDLKKGLVEILAEGISRGIKRGLSENETNKKSDALNEHPSMVLVFHICIKFFRSATSQEAVLQIKL